MARARGPRSVGGVPRFSFGFGNFNFGFRFFPPIFVFRPRRGRKKRRPRFGESPVPPGLPDLGIPHAQPAPGPFPTLPPPTRGPGQVIQFPRTPPPEVPIIGKESLGRAVITRALGAVNIAVIASEVLRRVSQNEQERIFREAEQAAEMEARRTGRDNPLGEIFFPDRAFPPGRFPEADEVDDPLTIPRTVPSLPEVPSPIFLPEPATKPVIPPVPAPPRPEIAPAPGPARPTLPAPVPAPGPLPLRELFPLDFPGFRVRERTRRQFIPAGDPVPEFPPIGDPLTPVRPSSPQFPSGVGFVDVGPSPDAQPQAAQQQCQNVARRRRRKGKCREGFFKEFPGSTRFVTWRTVDCVTRKEKPKLGRFRRTI